MNLSDFFVASPSEIAEIDMETSPLSRFKGVEAKGVEVVKIVTLLNLVDGSSFEDHLENLDDFFVRSLGDEGPWIIQVPTPVVDHISVGSTSQINDLADSWAATEEWGMDGASAEDLRPLLMDMSSLAHHAKSRGENLYVWVCL